MFLLAANIKELYSEVFDFTVKWKENIEELPSFAISRAAAYRRLADQEYRQKKCTDERLGSLLAKCSVLMKAVLEAQNFARWLIPELKKQIGEFNFYVSRGTSFGTFKLDDASSIKDLLRYLVANEAKLVLAGFPSQELNMLHELADDGGGATIQQDSRASVEEYIGNGFVIAQVKRGSRPNANYAFAQDERGTDYFIHVEVFEQGSWTNRHRLTPGAEVALKFEDTGRGAALTATEAWLIDP
jgi:hypothetical protein